MASEESRAAIDRQSISDKIADKVIEKLIESKKQKKVKEKDFMKLNLAKGKIKRGYVNYILLRRNGALDLKKFKIEDGAVYLPDSKTYHEAEGDAIWSYKKNPTIIQPEWSVLPLKREGLAKETREQGINVEGQRFIMKIAEEVAIGLRKKGGMGKNIILWIILAIGAIVAISFILGKPLF